MLWLTLWFTVILKIPALYLCYVIWWSVKDPPAAAVAGPDDRLGSGGAGEGPLRRPRLPEPGRRPGPHGSADRRRSARPVRAARPGRPA